MRAPTEQQAVPRIVEILADLLGDSARRIRLREDSAADTYDFLIRAPRHRFVAKYKRIASAGALDGAVRRLKDFSISHSALGLPLVVVPFMGQVGRGICERHGVGWIDLSGNARIDAPGLRIRIEGRPNKFIERGRSQNLFAPKSSRIARQLLSQPARYQSQAELARSTGLGDGYVSRLVRRLVEQGYVVRDEAGAIRAKDADLLLDAWRDAYDFGHHQIIRGHIAARSGEGLLRTLSEKLLHRRVDFAATGLAAAWLLTNFAAFRQVAMYLRALPPESLLDQISFDRESTGANVWLVIPDDDSVFDGQAIESGIPCVSPLQTYLDLKAQPERANEAADEVRKRFLNWSRDGY